MKPKLELISTAPIQQPDQQPPLGASSSPGAVELSEEQQQYCDDCGEDFEDDADMVEMFRGRPFFVCEACAEKIAGSGTGYSRGDYD